MNKVLKLLPFAALAVTALVGCNKKQTIFIFTAHEDNRIQLFNKELKLI